MTESGITLACFTGGFAIVGWIWTMLAFRLGPDTAMGSGGLVGGVFGFFLGMGFLAEPGPRPVEQITRAYTYAYRITIDWTWPATALIVAVFALILVRHIARGRSIEPPSPKTSTLRTIPAQKALPGRTHDL